MKPTAQAIVPTPIGKIAVFNTPQALTQIDLYADSLPYQIGHSNSLTNEITAQISAYFSGDIAQFDLPVNLAGTEFQQKVWQQLQAIPYGDSLTYGELAKKINSSARAIGGACRHNPIPIIIPCHRIVAATGIGGYSGQWRLGQKVDTKRWLLTHEKKWHQTSGRQTISSY
ncbi:methylated-DNA--[protein]-cysteine S-methyltransferase [Catenovulum sp. 2E275]|uniref:methylated-DNA--[protein]-cysteine S-methyltransferase n=1 Tax=Catenovulum sp. 2E275 TaxID=2980497 RepID=UPI0021CE9053|nr:methylated-DNA--[protein]-cysteine S-methyltransferase [Catenovulum sp. 2E275]MCU4674585.1 methylated-DNA--[protein]-cysteine S-methyltransferase [Catenovulum sp. 2E275]